MKLYLVRHGVSTGNISGSLLGQSDYPLKGDGEAQARAVAEVLAPLGPMPVYCSDLQRARQTAECIAAAWPGIEVRPDRRLREIDLGEYEGRSWEELSDDEALGAALEADPYNTALPGGESLALLKERVLAAVDEIVAAGPGEGRLGGSALAGGVLTGEASGGAAVAVAHDGPIRTILNTCLGVPPEKWWTLSISHGGLSLVEWTDGWVNVRFVNATSHLPAPTAPG
jgi:broad specificity phosphatase PhoE